MSSVDLFGTRLTQMAKQQSSQEVKQGVKLEQGNFFFI